jgi:hypothetical protein
MSTARGVLLVGSLPYNGQRITTCAIEEAYGQNTARGPFQLSCSPNEKIFTALSERGSGGKPDVRAAGQKLYNALVEIDPVRQMFARIHGTSTVGGPPSMFPLFVRLDAPDAENLPWEALFRDSFIVLDRDQRWPIGRLAATTARAAPLHRAIAPELRIAIVIAAQGEKGVAEWRSHSAAIEQANLPINILVLVSEDAVRAAVNADATRWQTGGVPCTVDVVYTGDKELLLKRLRTHLPNVIHFFCHGAAEPLPRLDLESRSDRTAGAGQSSIVLSAEDLKPLAQMGTLWLIVLNCCGSGKSNLHLNSFAQQLVEAGAPAVVAMRESVDVCDANVFSKLFYTDLLLQFVAVFNWRAAPNFPPPFLIPEDIWLRAVHRARVQLSSAPRSADSSVEWTYPVVYVNRDELRLSPRLPKFSTLPEAKRLELVAELDMLRAAHAAIQALMDQESEKERERLDKLIDDVQRRIAG